jgi:AMP-binding enzyme
MLQHSLLQCRGQLAKKAVRISLSNSFRVTAGSNISGTTFPRTSPSQSFVNRGAVSPNFESLKRQYHSNTAITEVERFTLDVKCLIELQENAVKKFGDSRCFGTRVGNNFEWISYREFGRLVEKFRNVLVHHKIGKNDKVALISNNRVEWAVAFYAVNGVGGQVHSTTLFFLPLSLSLCQLSFLPLFPYLFLLVRTEMTAVMYNNLLLSVRLLNDKLHHL